MWHYSVDVANQQLSDWDSSAVVSMVGRVRVGFRVRHQYVQGLKCARTVVTVHQFGPIYCT